MHIGHRYPLGQTLLWSWSELTVPFLWSVGAVAAYDFLGWHWLALPTLPLSLLGVAVAFYVGFKNNASYDRLWEARKIWGAIVNASRSWAYGARDLVGPGYGGKASDDELVAIHRELVWRHVAWMDALRFQLRKLQSWEHDGHDHRRARERIGLAELREDLSEVLSGTLVPAERDRVLAKVNPAAHLIANQSRRLAELRDARLLDGFGHLHLQELLQELMAQQGKAERIKNFPYPRQYATVNHYFAVLFAMLVPLGVTKQFADVGPHTVWLAVPFSAIVSWVFLTANRIGEWSENPFEGLGNDVPITQMSRGIERDIRQMLDETELPPARKPVGQILT